MDQLIKKKQYIGVYLGDMAGGATHLTSMLLLTTCASVEFINFLLAIEVGALLSSMPLHFQTTNEYTFWNISRETFSTNVSPSYPLNSQIFVIFTVDYLM